MGGRRLEIWTQRSVVCSNARPREAGDGIPPGPRGDDHECTRAAGDDTVDVASSNDESGVEDDEFI